MFGTAAGLAATASYPLLVRPWLLRWGATTAEPLPGDVLFAMLRDKLPYEQRPVPPIATTS